jgi:hypothetical protein
VLGALPWRASDLVNVTREAFGHHVEACFNARFPEKSVGREAPGTREFITKAIDDLQEARAMRGERRPAPPGAAPSPDEGSGLHVYINIPGLNRAASQELYGPSHVGWCEGPPHSYVRMPFGLLNQAAMHQCHMRSILAAHEARPQAILSEEASDPREPHGPPGPHEAQDPDGS